MIVKVCGMTQGENIRAVEALGADWLGFIFYGPSPRCLCQMPTYLPTRARRVGVFVHESQETILRLARLYALDYIQLHGDESPDYCHTLQQQGQQLIKAFSLSVPADLDQTHSYEGLCSYFLFDTRCPGRGGSGQSFDWSLLQYYNGQTPFLLSGGLHPDSASELQAFHHPQWAGIDLNSRFEVAPGVKDPERISALLMQLNNK